MSSNDPLQVAKARVDSLEALVRILEAENQNLRTALRVIANAESGGWGRIAGQALHPREAKQ